MCIRDRAYFLQVQGSGRVRLRDGSVMRVGYAGDNGHPYRCLLYTSDAADERSSVDLGGRRIIKKKKNELTNVQATRETETKHKPPRRTQRTRE